MREFGFWEYTCPGGGKAARYAPRDWEVLLDDMASSGMDSLALAVKCHSTDYKSALGFANGLEARRRLIALGKAVLGRSRGRDLA